MIILNELTRKITLRNLTEGQIIDIGWYVQKLRAFRDFYRMPQASVAPVEPAAAPGDTNSATPTHHPCVSPNKFSGEKHGTYIVEVNFNAAGIISDHQVHYYNYGTLINYFEKLADTYGCKYAKIAFNKRSHNLSAGPVKVLNPGMKVFYP